MTMGEGIVITVAICTYNRSVLLEKTLLRLCEINPPIKHAWEVLVINNRCTDDTEKVLAKFVGKLPIRWVFEAKQGLSNARNAAIDQALGKYIIWTDDDVLVGENWLSAYEDAFLRHPDAAIFGGPIVPWFEQEPPTWIAENLSLIASAFAVRDLGTEEAPLQLMRDTPLGANFCIRTAEQRQFKYDPSLGRNAKKTVLGEETEVMKALFAAGATGWWLPSASVRHWIPANRLTHRYLRDYYRGVGRTSALTAFDGSTRLFGIPRWAIRQYLIEGGRYYLARIFSSNATRKIIDALCKFEMARGLIEVSLSKGR